MVIYMAKILYDDEFIRLNMGSINNATVQSVKKMLVDRTSNLEHPDFSMDYKDIVAITAIDHFVCKKIINGETIAPGSRFKAYLEELEVQLLRQPLLFLSLPIRNIDLNLLKKYLPNIDRIVDLCKKKRNEAQIVNDKLKKGLPVSNNEINTLVKYFSYSCNNDSDEKVLEAQDRLVKYILNSRTLGLYSSSFIMKYLGYKKCRELGLEGIQILVGDLTSMGAGVKGLSYLKTITISKKDLVGTTFKNNSLDTEFQSLNTGQLEGLICLKNLYHELRHAFQDKEHFAQKATDVSYMMSIRKILFQNDSMEYDRNYRNYNIEADANQYGWIWLGTVLKDYMNLSSKDRCTIYTELYRYEHYIKKNFASKVDKEGHRRYIGLFEKENLDEYFKKNPGSLQKDYSHFRIVYNDDGTPKGLNELIRIKASSTVDFPNFYLSQVSARMVSGESFDYKLFDRLSIEERKNILINFHDLVYSIYSKFSALKQKLTNGEYLLDNMKGVDHQAIRYNVIRYFKLAMMYAKEMSVFINRYPELMNYGADHYLNGPTNTNMLLSKINSNEIVQRFVDGRQIELVAVPGEAVVSKRMGK